MVLIVKREWERGRKINRPLAKVDKFYQIHLCSSVFICGLKSKISIFARSLIMTL